MLPTVTIVCTEASHPGRTMVVDRFEIGFRSLASPTLGNSWLSGASTLPLDPEEEPSSVRATVAQLDGDTFAGNRRDRFGEIREGHRERFALRCHLCDLSVPARAEKLFPLLDALSSAGVSEISLTALAPRLK